MGVKGVLIAKSFQGKYMYEPQAKLGCPESCEGLN